MDRYITVVKRGRSPKSSKVSSVPKISRDKDADSINSHNRFSLLKDKNDEVTPLVKALFYVIPIKRGNIDETKIQVNTETDYRKITAELDKDKKDYYTYQLKSAKGMQIVLKGIDSCVDPLEPMFRVELEPNDTKLKNEIHPIYDLKFLLHRKITVEEPHKRTGPVQCHNWLPVYSVVKLSMKPKPKPVSDQARNVLPALSLIPKWPKQPQNRYRMLMLLRIILK
ncbi:hypothetical protein EVAR_91010_1 [Eumeta japonica]|uniref:Pre-C2HC domain-containing protein n=1 Tax=Eumeta variegata TaxID=151549 RepID=A0A4C1T287_EUMVA|nr:hypothetical protein EVAR_91010_1 [Eumeta japonica]